MARWNPDKRLLDHEHSQFWKYRLVEVDEPNLMRDIFPYSEIARIDFDYKFVMPSPAEHMLITDTTFRDGQQARPPYTVSRWWTSSSCSTGSPGPRAHPARPSSSYTPTRTGGRGALPGPGLSLPEVTGWIRADTNDLKLVKEMGLKETGILTSVSDYHIFLKLKRRPPPGHGRLPGHRQGGPGVGHRAPVPLRGHHPRGYLWLLRAFRLEAHEAPGGVRHPSRSGCATPWAMACLIRAALPRSVSKARAGHDRRGRRPGEWLEWHGHNDFHKVLVNARHRLALGCGAANGTLLGFGERTGNSPIEGLVMEYISSLARDD